VSSEFTGGVVVDALEEGTYGDALEGRIPRARTLSIEEHALVDGDLQVGHLQVLPLVGVT
jgi:hypothetical protein